MAEILPSQPEVPPDGGHTPDIMNDPQYATNAGQGEDDMGDPDTCRICRGEGSDSEPLFHPCKCSGSIKYVHQDCLMEWLSHSQKKHCELCKTAFRFTKLYSPNMPTSVPFRVLVWHLAVHSVHNITTWLRFCLVVTVWLGALPYAIRQVWRLLFWFSDGGWPPDNPEIEALANTTTVQAYEIARELQLASLMGNGTSPATPLHPAPTSPAGMGVIMNQLIGFFMPISQALNVSAVDPLAAGFFKSLYYGLGISSLIVPEGSISNTSVSQYFMESPASSHTPSLLSEISFLRNLTRSYAVNGIVITIAEGYIITILVVVCFILVFLIREWVVQQQPGINMGAGFNAEFAAQRPREEAAADLIEGRDPAARPMARVRRRNNHLGAHEEPAREARAQIGPPVRDAQYPASEIQRGVTDEPRMAEEFLNIWRRADGNVEEVLRIIEDEGKGDDLRYWVNALKKEPNAENGRRSPRIPSPVRDTSTLSTIAEPPSPRILSETSQQQSSENSTGSSESWQDIPEPLIVPDFETLRQTYGSARHREDDSRVVDKGKGKAKETEQPDGESQHFDGSPKTSSTTGDDDSPSRAFSGFPPNSTLRAISSGSSQANDSSNWSFANLPDEPSSSKDAPTFSWDEEKQRRFERNARMIATIGRVKLPDTKDGESGPSKLLIDFDSNAPSGKRQDAKVEESSLLKAHGEVDEGGPVRIQGQDGVLREYDDWDHVFEANPVKPEEQVELAPLDAPEPNPFHPDVPLPGEREPNAVRPAEPQGFLGNVADFLWGGVGEDRRQDEPGPNDEHIVQNLAAEPPFVPVAHNEALEQGALAEQDRDVVQAAIAAGLDPNDPDGIDDAEDFEGIMELVGMRGPVFSLVQNALFSAFLLALTVAFGVWIPYNLGRIAVLLLANPGPAFKLPLRLVFSCAAFLQDLGLSILGLLSYCAVHLLFAPFNLWKSYKSSTEAVLGSARAQEVATAALELSYSAGNRIVEGTLTGLVHITDSEIFAFSAASHESLIGIKNLIINSVAGLGTFVVWLFSGNYQLSLAGTLARLDGPLRLGGEFFRALPSWFLRPDSWVISLEMGKRSAPLDLQLSVWYGWDRFWAVVIGYAALSFLGALYVKKGSPFSNGQVGRDWEATIIDLLNQAGGVMKVILIISIEMLVFPLYCGLLLDAALLPLFDNTTLWSRLLFTVKSPCTSIFVHWFVGTCYMFHFALFVSMCRKIMRKGVLYFIRDPDDPTFHPVRDVLERNVATQLRKILFSALVYGGLVVICLGGVVWGLAYAFKGVLPIHWSSNEPVLEFPIDLLFYNFLMPLAVKVFKPSDGLHAMYTWWFRQCARILRLTWFMFDERNEDEEGVMVHRSWIDVLRGATADPRLNIAPDDDDQYWIDHPEARVYFRRDGRYVRAPASDQVRIPKGSRIFLEVDELNNRIDGKPDRADGIHGNTSDLCKQVYVPPWFRVRICLFILFIWLFAALTGVCITIVPLVFGRHIFAKIIPPHVRKNDVYAFSIGIYILGSSLYAILHAKQFYNYLRTALEVDANTPQNVLRRATIITTRFSSIAWTYASFLFILPTLFAMVIEFYFILPLHTYFAIDELHVIHFVQSWTLGLLYVKLTTRIILWHEESRPAQSLRAITRDGYLNPNAGIATRAFIIPATFILTTALFAPFAFARIAVITVLRNSTEKHLMAYRYAYPMTLCAVLVGIGLWVVMGWIKEWRMKIRDEVYLIGERLHNFGDRKVAGAAGVAVSGIRGLGAGVHRQD